MTRPEWTKDPVGPTVIFVLILVYFALLFGLGGALAELGPTCRGC